MKLYDFSLAPNPRRVRMFLAEKGVEVPMVQVNTREREQFTDWFQKINPRGTVPVLELDDGTVIVESVAICRYLEETRPEPPLMGVDPLDKAVVEMWHRRVELELSALALFLRVKLARLTEPCTGPAAAIQERDRPVSVQCRERSLESLGKESS